MKPTVWIVEGADGAGKSTFAQNMVNQHRAAGVPAKMIHNGPPGDATKLYDLYKLQIVRALQRRDTWGETTVIDRSFLSELLYGKFRKGGSQLTKRQVRRLERFCYRKGVILLGLIASHDLRKSRVLARGEEWTNVYAFTGAQYAHYFQSSKFWVTAESFSATASNESN